MNEKKLLKCILDIGEEMLKSGAGTARVEDSLYRIVKSYGFVNPHIWVINTNIEATVETVQGDIFTQIRHVSSMDTNFDRLDYLNNLSRKICKEKPDIEAMKQGLDEVLSRKPQAVWMTYAAGIMGGTGFGVFFNCNVQDALVAILASIIIVFAGSKLGKMENNPLIYNFMISFIVETVILFSTNAGIGSHPGYITIGVVMLLISGLGTANGIKDLLHKDTLSGIMEIWNSILGASGIAGGIALPLLMIRGSLSHDRMVLNPSVSVQLASCTVACVGFALWFKIKGTQVIYAGIGAYFTWGTYVIVENFVHSNFIATFVGAIFVAMYSHLMAKVNKAPATIFQTASVFPLIPGPNLYYMMYYSVIGDSVVAKDEAFMLLETCLGIALGFILVDIAYKYINYIFRANHSCSCFR